MDAPENASSWTLSRELAAQSLEDFEGIIGAGDVQLYLHAKHGSGRDSIGRIALHLNTPAGESTAWLPLDPFRQFLEATEQLAPTGGIDARVSAEYMVERFLRDANLNPY